jgi:hypothetical protein
MPRKLNETAFGFRVQFVGCIGVHAKEYKMRQSFPVPKGIRILTFLEKMESLDQDIDEKFILRHFCTQQ